MSKSEEKNSGTQKAAISSTRLGLLLVLVVIWALILGGRAFYLQVIKGDELSREAIAYQTTWQKMQGKRGDIVDRNGNVLATSIKSVTLVAMPANIPTTVIKLQVLAKQIASAVDMDERVVFDKIANDRSYVRLKLNLNETERENYQALVKDLTAQLKAAKIANRVSVKSFLYLEDGYQRYYPEGENASHLLGWTNLDGVGQSGMEAHFEDLLKPKIEKTRMVKMAGSTVLADDNAANADLDGQTLQLSIDSRIQNMAQKTLENAVVMNAALSGCITVMDVKTGEILAWANYPTFDLNEYGQATENDRRNRVITDAFEPGSVFKTFATVAYMEKHPNIRPDTVILATPNDIPLKGKILKEHGLRRNNLTPAMILAYSSNIGAATMALDVGPEQYYDTLRKFGFGQVTGVELTGEVSGTLRDPHKSPWLDVNLANIGFGQGVTVNNLQLAAAYAAIANNGVYNKPTLLVRKNSQKADTKKDQTVSRRIISEKLAKDLQYMLSTVVTTGTGKRAAMVNYTAAGKTGTAQKVVDRRYSDTDWMASFAGFAPVEEPRVAIMVNIDSPQPLHEGGAVSAPVFKDVMTEALSVLQVPSSPNRAVAKKSKAAKIVDTADERDVPVEFDKEETPVTKGQLGSFKGLSIKEALAKINKKLPKDTPVTVNTSGLVVAQEPAADTPLKNVKYVKLICEFNNSEEVISN